MLAIFVAACLTPAALESSSASSSTGAPPHAASLSPSTATLKAKPHADLMVYRDTDGRVRPVESVADWQKRRAEILRAMQDVMGAMPGKEKLCPLDVKVEEETDCGSYVRRLISYVSEPGCRTPAYLLIPQSAIRNPQLTLPAVLCLHPTDNTLGFKVAVGLGGKPNRDYARELAERGFVAIAPSYPLLANYQPDLKALGYASGTMKAIWDNRRALDLLDSLPFVRRGRYGAIGHSLGGHNAIFTAVFDERIEVIVSSCGFDSFSDYYGGDPANWQPERGWCQTRYMSRLAAWRERLAEIPFDFHELIGALAPRVCFINAPLGDANFRWRSVDEIVAAASQVYRLHGAPLNLRVEHPDCEHDFPDKMRATAYQLIEDGLR
ncbi:MAG: alpha/beta hydrolase [Candidatus Sumerlaeota bacterium]|nr:alpha/beta hydrolase [Candidatus Sumerlaeota bacterium]